MWKKLQPITKEREAALRHQKKIKIYVDEDIEPEVVRWLRANHINVTSARELGQQGKPHSSQLAHAFKQTPFLLTKNAKHYLNGRDAPFHRIHGIIAVHGRMGDTFPYGIAVGRILDFVNYVDITLP